MSLEDYYENLKRLDTPVMLRAGLRGVPKGRPRFSRKSGAAYTPKETREFETQIRVLAASVMGHRPPYSCPVKVTIRFYEPPPVSFSKLQTDLAMAGLIVPPKGDLDNRVKAVTDAMNGVVYHDDKQIGDMVQSKRYGPANLITVTIERTGLSDLEIDRYKKMQKVNDGQLAGKRRPTVG